MGVRRGCRLLGVIGSLPRLLVEFLDSVAKMGDPLTAPLDFSGVSQMLEPCVFGFSFDNTVLDGLARDCRSLFGSLLVSQQFVKITLRRLDRPCRVP